MTTRTRLSPKKLLHTKWTAVTPRDREKHFLVTKVIEPTPPDTVPTEVELEAVIDGRVRRLPWRTLTDREQWLPGWL
jgi:tryptophan-rich hypothetical protein